MYGEELRPQAIRRTIPGAKAGSARMAARVMVVQEFSQLLAQTFIALSFVTEHDCALEQHLLLLVRHLAPQVGRRRTKHEKIAGFAFVGGNRLRWRRHA
jgi:hypothetical protein